MDTVLFQLVGTLLLIIGGYVMYLVADSGVPSKADKYLMALGAFIVVIGVGAFMIPVLHIP